MWGPTTRLGLSRCNPSHTGDWWITTTGLVGRRVSTKRQTPLQSTYIHAYFIYFIFTFFPSWHPVYATPRGPVKHTIQINLIQNLNSFSYTIPSIVSNVTLGKQRLVLSSTKHQDSAQDKRPVSGVWCKTLQAGGLQYFCYPAQFHLSPSFICMFLESWPVISSLPECALISISLSFTRSPPVSSASSPRKLTSHILTSRMGMDRHMVPSSFIVTRKANKSRSGMVQNQWYQETCQRSILFRNFPTFRCLCDFACVVRCFFQLLGSGLTAGGRSAWSAPLRVLRRGSSPGAVADQIISGSTTKLNKDVDVAVTSV